MVEVQQIAILGGTGSLGFGLSVRLANAGHKVVIGSRKAERATGAAERVTKVVPGTDVSGDTNENAVAGADFVIVAVPFVTQADTLKSVKPHLAPDQILIDACVPLGPAIGGKPLQLVGVWHGSAAQQAQALVPEGVRVVSGMHTLSADDLADPSLSLDQDTLICGDSKEDKTAVTNLLASFSGLRVIDAGRLEMSRMVEGITPVLIGINIRYKAHSGFKVTGLS